jgi:hypothetical protein
LSVAITSSKAITSTSIIRLITTHLLPSSPSFSLYFNTKFSNFEQYEQACIKAQL